MKLIQSKNFCATIQKLVSALVNENWCLIGGRAVEVHANPPQSPDIDILIDGTTSDPEALIIELKKYNIVLKESYEPGDIVFMIDKSNSEEVDLIPTYDDFEIKAIGRARRGERFECVVGSVSSRSSVKFPVVQVEDLVILKAVAACDLNRTGLMGRGEEKVKRDIKAIQALAKDSKLDKQYIIDTLMRERWPKELKMLRTLRVV